MAGGQQFVQLACAALDRAIAAVAQAEFVRLSDGLEVDEVAGSIEATFESLDRLRPGKQPEQPDYDGWDSLFYASWYQPRQVHLVYAILRHLCPRGVPDQLHVVDVGCGAWAVQMALAIRAAESRRNSCDSPVTVHGIDPSADMRRLGEELWVEWRNCSAADRRLERLVDQMDAMSVSCGTYNSYETWASSACLRHTPRSGVRRWLTAVHAVYKTRIHELDELYCGVWDHLVDLRASGELDLVIATSDGSKKVLVDFLTDEEGSELRPDPVWSGAASHTTAWRRSMRERLESHLGSKGRAYLNNDVKWDYPRNPIRRDAVRVLTPGR
ncbi:MAG: class I SAM-dependent methyltransferase [Holophagales bacterium]|nr:class I SAM-dependent methyltransferase [Holophagales bacterium]MYF94793.1 class I SAM-dependent methyltransferase [Holophagales bacterium]